MWSMRTAATAGELENWFLVQRSAQQNIHNFLWLQNVRLNH